jgi:hypothetical protein
MSETQRRVTGSFQAVDESGNEYHVVEYTDFRHTTTAEITYGDEDGGVKEYELANGAPLKRVSETHFEIEPDGVKISRKN